MAKPEVKQEKKLDKEELKPKAKGKRSDDLKRDSTYIILKKLKIHNVNLKENS